MLYKIRGIVLDDQHWRSEAWFQGLESGCQEAKRVSFVS